MSAAVVGAPTVSGRRGILVVFGGLMLVMLMAALDQTIVSTALPTIVGDLGGLSHISWVVTAYLLAQTAVTPIYGKLGDQYSKHTDPLAEASRAVSSVVGRERRRRMVERLSERAGLDPAPGSAWLIVRLYENPAADVENLCASFDVPTAGEDAGERLIAERRAKLARLCEPWDPDLHPDLAEVLYRLARELAREPARELAGHAA